MLRNLSLALAVTALVLAGCADNGPTSAPSTPASPMYRSAVIPGAYIVELNDGVDASRVPDVASEMAHLHAASIGHVYQAAIKGFSVHMSAVEAEQLALDPRVKNVEPDQLVTLVIQKRPTNPGGGGGSTTPPPQVTSWGCTRVGGPSTLTADGKAYIIDTGIDMDHPDLVIDKTTSRNYCSRATTWDDGNGHGTHVAGIIAAVNNTIGTVGVAPGATVVAVRVLDAQGSGTYSDIIAGVNYVASVGRSGDVANMSLGGPASTTLDNAVAGLGAAGVKVTVAAGNSGTDCSSTSPARVNAPNVYTVSATGSNDCLTSWSNYGQPVDWAEPGLNITSLWKGGGTNTISGTSMAAPHLAGILLLVSPPTNGGNVCSGSDRDSWLDMIGHL